jgi:hypothetical protein
MHEEYEKMTKEYEKSQKKFMKKEDWDEYDEDARIQRMKEVIRTKGIRTQEKKEDTKP